MLFHHLLIIWITIQSQSFDLLLHELLANTILNVQFVPCFGHLGVNFQLHVLLNILITLVTPGEGCRRGLHSSKLTLVELAHGIKHLFFRQTFWCVWVDEKRRLG